MISQPRTYATRPPFCFAQNQHAILAAIHAQGLLVRRDLFGHNHELVRPSGRVTRTPEQDEYPLWIADDTLSDLQRIAPQIAAALGLPAVTIEPNGRNGATIICRRELAL